MDEFSRANNICNWTTSKHVTSHRCCRTKNQLNEANKILMHYADRPIRLVFRDEKKNATCNRLSILHSSPTHSQRRNSYSKWYSRMKNSIRLLIVCLFYLILIFIVIMRYFSGFFFVIVTSRFFKSSLPPPYIWDILWYCVRISCGHSTFAHTRTNRFVS